MENLKIRYLDDENKPQSLEFLAPKVYEKDFYLSARNLLRFESAESLKRRILWMAKNNFRISNSYRLGTLSKKYKNGICLPSFFDHTYFLRIEGNKRAVLCLTEPYSHFTEDKNRSEILKLESTGLKVKWFLPSQNSLHCPNHTSMVFIWNPDRFTWNDEYWSYGKKT